MDVAAHAYTVKEPSENLRRISDPLNDKMQKHNIELLWGTANLFSHPRYMAGAATNPDPEVFKCAAYQVKNMLELTHQLGGKNYVLWGGREGYETILNTNMKKELNNLARFLELVVEYKHKIGFKGQILLEPKPHEPTKHQYDFDSASCLALLRKIGLDEEIKLNIEVSKKYLKNLDSGIQKLIIASKSKEK